MNELFGDDLLARPRREVAPGAVHVPGWLTLEQQAWIVDRFREWAAGPVPRAGGTDRRTPDVRAHRLPGLALAALPLHARGH